MAIKLATFIFMALAVSCASVQDQLKKLEAARHPFLAPYSDLTVANPAQQVANELNAALLISGDASAQEWLDFMLGTQSENADMSVRGDNDLDEARLTELALAEADHYYPDLTPDQLAKVNVQWMKEDGYMTMLPYFLNAYRELKRRYYVAQLFRIAKGNGANSISVSNAADNKVFHTVLDKIQAYAAHFHDGEETIVERDGQQYIVNAAADKNHADAVRIVQDSFKNTHETVYPAYFDVLQFQLSLAYYLKGETDYLFAKAQIADAKDADSIADRLADLIKKQLIMSRAGKSSLSADQIASNTVSGYATAMKDQSAETETFRNTIAPKLYGKLLKLFAHELSAETSLALIKKYIRQRLAKITAISPDIIRKDSLVAGPFTGTDQKPELSALAAWDFIQEAADKPSEETLKWWLEVSDHAGQILAVKSSKGNALNTAKTLFRDTLIGREHSKAFLTSLYNKVLQFVDAKADELTTAEFAAKLDAFLDQDADTNNFYLLQKIYVANMLPNDGYKVSWASATAEQKKVLADFIAGAQGKYILQAINQAHIQKNGGKATLKTSAERIDDLVSKSRESKDFTVMNWGKRIVL